MMSGRPSRNFLTVLSNRMTPNTMVTKGWYYRSSPIMCTENSIGIIINDPYWSLAITEKLRFSKKTKIYSIEDVYEDTMIADVLWNGNYIESIALKNLVVMS